MTDPDLLVRKAELRALMLERRAGVAARLAEPAADAVARRLVESFELWAGMVVAGYWPLVGELDPRPALHRLAGAGLVVALPRMRGRREPLAFHRWQRGDTLIEGLFKVMEPAATAPEVHPDVVLAPLLAFDGRGRRLGYGQGFYDRTLAGLRRTPSGTRAIGLAFAAQEVDEVPADDTDERLDAVVTEEAVRRFAGPSA